MSSVFWLCVLLLYFLDGIFALEEEYEIGGKGVSFDRWNKKFVKKVSLEEASTDYMGDYIMYHLLSDPRLGCGDYSFLNLDTISIEKTSRNKATFSRQLFPANSLMAYRSQGLLDKAPLLLGKTPNMPKGWDVPVQKPGEKFTFTEENINQFALIALVDTIVLNTDRFNLGLRNAQPQVHNIMWYHEPSMANHMQLLPIDNGWGFVIMIAHHNNKGGVFFNADEGKIMDMIRGALYDNFRPWLRQIAHDEKTVVDRAMTLWGKNEAIFKSMDIPLKHVADKIAKYWMKHRAYITSKIRNMMNEQFPKRIAPLFDSTTCTYDGDQECFDQKSRVKWMKEAIGTNLAILEKARPLSARLGYDNADIASAGHHSTQQEYNVNGFQADHGAQTFQTMELILLALVWILIMSCCCALVACVAAFVATKTLRAIKNDCSQCENDSNESAI